ncbi:O-methyltransferase [Mariniluteicoccus endophyticus]
MTDTHGSLTSTKLAPSASSWVYAEDFRPDAEAMQKGRSSAAELGQTPLTRGSTSLLTVLARAVDAKAVVEIGTNAGVSGLALFAGMNDQGILTSVDGDHENQAAARRLFSEQGLPARRFRLIAGTALDVLPKLSSGAYDVVFVNGDKLEYGEYVEQALRLLRHGGLMILNSCLWSDRIADVTNEEDETIVLREALENIQENKDLVATLLPVGDGLVVAVKA